MNFRLLVIASVLFAADVANAADYAAWRKANTDGSWTQAAETGISATPLPDLVPKDIAEFCPNYASLDLAERKRFWVGLLSAMARPESNFKPDTTYREPDITDAAGKNVTSRGLLQISLESANQNAYSCGIKRAEDLHDPAVNLACGAKIMSYWVKRESLIAAQVKPAVGAARYWSVLRAWRNHLPEITGFTKSLEFCKKAL
jgi:hypothetical protein